MSYIEMKAADVLDACDHAARLAHSIFEANIESEIEATMKDGQVKLGWFKGTRKPTREEAVVRVLEGLDDGFSIESEAFWIKRRRIDTLAKIAKIRTLAEVAVTYSSAKQYVKLDKGDVGVLRDALLGMHE